MPTTHTRPRPLTGAITALATPFKNDAVAYDDLRKLVEFQIKSGINGLCPVGTTGESPTLSHDEHLDVIRATIDYTRGRVPVIAGTGSNSTQEAIEYSRAALEAGADGLLLVAPYYNKPSQEGLYRHFAAIAEITDKPIVLYSIPARCGIEIGVPTIERLRAKYPHVRYIKEAGGSVDRVDQLKQAMGRDITVLSGDDSLTLPFMSVGAEGIISVASNIIPREVTKLAALANAHDYAQATKLHRKLYPLFKALFIEPNPVPVKTALARARIIATAAVRPPLCEMSAANEKTLATALTALSK